MTPNELDRLIAMLEPSAEEVTVDFVRRTLAGAIECVPTSDSQDEPVSSECTALRSQANPSSASEDRTQQQSVDAFDPWLPNDPRNW